MSGHEGLMGGQRGVRDVKPAIGTNQRERLTQEEARRLFDYDPETGTVTRLITTSSRARAGEIVGSIMGAGYLSVSINHSPYLLHRLIWLWWYGYFPENFVDHINRNTSDNRLCNLREVSIQCNARNSSLFSTNSSGVKGVSWFKQEKGWRADIRVNGPSRHLGCFKDFTEAVSHRLAAEQYLEWEGCDSSSTAFQYMQKYLKEIKDESDN